MFGQIACGGDRLARVPYIGVPRQAVVGQMQRQADLRAGRDAVMAGYGPPPGHADFYGHQAGGFGGGMGGGAVMVR